MGVYLFSKNKVCLFNKNHILLFRESTFVPTPMQNQTHIVIFCCYWAILWSFNALIWGSYCLKVKIVFVFTINLGKNTNPLKELENVKQELY